MFFRFTNRLNDGVSPSATPSPDSAPSPAEVVKAPETPTANKKYKVRGKEIEVPADKLDYYIQMGLVSNEKLNEAAATKKEAQEILDSAKTKRSAKAALEKAGFNSTEIREILENELRGYYEDEAMTPEERTARQEREELDKYRKDKEESAQTEAQKQQEVEVARELQVLETELLDALGKSSLPKNPVLAKWAVQYMNAYEQKGVDLPADQAIKLVEREFPLLVQSVVSDMTPADLKSFLGDSTVRKLLDDSVAAVKNAEAPFVKQNQAAKAKPPAQPQQQSNESYSNYFEQLRRGKI